MVASIVDVFQVLKDDTETGYVSGTFSFMLLSVCCAHQDDVFVLHLYLVKLFHSCFAVKI